MIRIPHLIALMLLCVMCGPALAWDQAGHRTINLLALKALPESFPQFVHTPEARERIAHLASEPDRWRSSPDYPFRHVNEPDHFFDVDYLAGFSLKSESLSPYRYDFVAQLAVARVHNPSIEPVSDPKRDPAHYRGHIGFLPWAINEHYAKLRTTFSTLKTFEKYGGTQDEIHNSLANAIYLMGLMGHFVGDATQPLHTTKHFNGWVGSNPDAFTTNKTFHAWIDGGFLAKAGFDGEAFVKRPLTAKVIERANTGNEGLFAQTVEFINSQHKLARTLYQLDKDGKLDANGKGAGDARAFLEKQLEAGAQMLADIWLTAWETAGDDNFLRAELAKRQIEARK